jgi:hypothetical protein
MIDGARLPRLNTCCLSGTAARDGRVNVSPKALDTLRVVGPNRVVWLNLTGCGGTAAET